MQLLTPRLMLRPWRDADRQPFAEMSRDPQVMQYLRPLATAEACNAWIDGHIAHQEAHGFCLWPCELRESGAFVGAVGLCYVAFEAHFTPAVEIGWRTARQFWGQGYATEAADAVLGFGFREIDLPEIVAQAVPQNVRSRRVMEKLGMSRDPADDHDHPLLPEGDPRRPHVLYRLRRGEWLARNAG